MYPEFAMAPQAVALAKPLGERRGDEKRGKVVVVVGGGRGQLTLVQTGCHVAVKLERNGEERRRNGRM